MKNFEEELDWLDKRLHKQCLMSVLQGIYDSEINIKLTSCWDGGWHVWIGGYPDYYDGSEKPDAYISRDELVKLPKIISELAIKHFPDSEYAKKYKE